MNENKWWGTRMGAQRWGAGTGSLGGYSLERGSFLSECVSVRVAIRDPQEKRPKSKNYNGMGPAPGDTVKQPTVCVRAGGPCVDPV